MLYYRILSDNERFADRWFLDEPLATSGEEIDAREFTYGCPYAGLVPRDIPIQQVGREVQFNLAAFDMPVASQDVAQLVEQIAAREVESFAVTIGSSISGYAILNAVWREACVDEQRSRVMWWKPEDGRPDKVGKYRMVSDLTIDAARTHDRHIFRVEDFEIALIVSEEIKVRLEELSDLGVVFRPVC